MLYDVKFTIVYNNGQRAESGTRVDMNYPSESEAVDKMLRSGGYPKDARIIIHSIKPV